ncbi:hypothetical protein GCM10025734_22380 [Kitasatospora paranensis]|uniref:hypothetical protein n=1 Tax=Kitasatospora paranensis TaxID=258053 RepID=UPI0031EAD9BF
MPPELPLQLATQRGCGGADLVVAVRGRHVHHLLQEVPARQQSAAHAECAGSEERQFASGGEVFRAVRQQSQDDAEPVRGGGRSGRGALLGGRDEDTGRLRIPVGHRPLDMVGPLDDGGSGGGDLCRGPAVEVLPQPRVDVLVDELPDQRMAQCQPSAVSSPQKIALHQPLQCVDDLLGAGPGQ